MIAHLNHILIFKTNIDCPEAREKLRPVLDAHSAIRQWSVDLHDCDCVLRVISETLKPDDIIAMANAHGFECSELE
ncbi:MAG: hypothetical protein H7Y27_13015 [Gemmatimonadaceae bacterium]|nr:hypothetical protein [Chitinophagaceae bacterium]